MEAAMKQLTDIDVLVIGSGPGGMAAALAAKENGAKNVLVVERDTEPGGILLQCIHNGFGMEIFKEDLPGPSYAQRFVEQVYQAGIDFLLDAMVIDISPTREVVIANKQLGLLTLKPKAIVLAMGCRERSRAQIQLPGCRPNGVFTAGTAQRWVNIEGYMPGKRFVILGSGDIGMIMARRLTFEGAKVEKVLEIMPYISGLTRNYVQCLLDYDIPLQLNHTVSRIIGKDRVEAIESVAVDENRRPIAGTEEITACDSLLLSVGLIPENELSKQAGVILDPRTNGPIVNQYFATNVPGFFAAGNVVHVYDLADWVTQAGYKAGKYAAYYAKSAKDLYGKSIPVLAGENVRTVVPQQVSSSSKKGKKIEFQFRVPAPVEEPVKVSVLAGGKEIETSNFRYARPGEMMDIKIDRKDIPDSAEAITVSCLPRKRRN
jgi:NADPH-dependent 2,4-dienoyl-CoA reductase/sulfur reductase-like enzyme